jgi:uncharacterized protein (TIGR03790 family)
MMQCWQAWMAATIAAVTLGAYAQQTPPSPPPASSTDPAPARWLNVPGVNGHLTAKDIGLVINTADPYSVEVGSYYAERRGLKPEQVLRVALPLHAALTPAEFESFATTIAEHFDARIQALALAWTFPFAVGCNSITGALALGYDASLCEHSCQPSRRSAYFDSATTQPFTDLKWRPSMLIASKSVADAKALIDRGVSSDGTLGLRGAPPVNAYFMVTSDPNRSVRARLFPPAGMLRNAGIDVHVEHADRLDTSARVVLYETGLTRVEGIDQVPWVPGALADHLTSFGGYLDGSMGQMSALDWLGSGATASYGTVSEPCSHPQKFPHPQVLLLNYAQGATALEAYWKSVAWPQQGLFVGEPLAAPFARVRP